MSWDLGVVLQVTFRRDLGVELPVFGGYSLVWCRRELLVLAQSRLVLQPDPSTDPVSGSTWESFLLGGTAFPESPCAHRAG